MSVPEELLQAEVFFSENSAGYTSWGTVQVLEVWMKKDHHSCWKLDLRHEHKSITTLSLQGSGMAERIFQKKQNVRFVIITHQENASQIREEIPPILDDQAQLLGVSIRVASGENDILRALSGRFAAILSDGRCVCVGQTLEDAWVAAQLLEKTSKVFLYARYLGGAKPIHRLEAWLMQKFYQMKYSREATRNIKRQ